MSFKYKDLTIDELSIKIGATKPFSFLHVTDSHIARWDKDKPCDRWKCFGDTPEKPERYFEQAADYCRENGTVMLNTGDMIDFLSNESLRYIDKAFEGLDYIYAAGNHDFCHRVGDATENKAYKMRNLALVAPHIKSNLNFDSRVINGINFVTLDDGYYMISDAQCEMLRFEAAKGLPIILCVHNPFYAQKTGEMMLEENGSCALVNTPLEVIEKFRDPYRRFQQEPDEATIRACEYIMGEPLIKAIFCGHLHKYFDEMLPNGVMQYCGAASFVGRARLVTVE